MPYKSSGGYWHGYLSGARCRLAYGPANATAIDCLLLLKKIQIGFTFLVPAHPCSPGKKAVKRVCACVCVCVCVCVLSSRIFFQNWRRKKSGKRAVKRVCVCVCVLYKSKVRGKNGTDAGQTDGRMSAGIVAFHLTVR